MFSTCLDKTVKGGREGEREGEGGGERERGRGSEVRNRWPEFVCVMVGGGEGGG